MSETDPLLWISDNLRRLPLTEKEKPWKRLLLDYEEELKTLLQHYDPLVRYHSCSTLMLSETTVARRLLWDLFYDSHSLVRTLMVRAFHSNDRQKLYNILFKLYLRDSVFSVRKEALQRIRSDFADLYSLSPQHLVTEEKVHCIELLDLNSAHDHSLALEFMKVSTPGIIMAASLYLEKAGTLDEMISKGSERDLDDLNRRLRILQIATAHQVSSFLEKKENFKTKGSLYLGIEILKIGVKSTQTSWIMKKVLSLEGQDIFTTKLKTETLSCLITRKEPQSIQLIKEFLESERINKKHRALLLENLPSEGAVQFYPVLYRFLLDRQFSEFSSLITAFSKIPLSLCLSDLYALVRNEECEKEVRKRGFILLSQYNDFSSTLFLIENLSLLSADEMKSLGTSVFQLNKEQFLYAAQTVFRGSDSSLHQKLMYLCSLAGIRDFVSVMVEKLTDSDPESRIMAVQSLKSLDASDYLFSIVPLLYDPVSKVRANTASMLIDWNKTETFNEFISILNDKNESISVQESIIESMGSSASVRTIEILVTLLETNPFLKEQTESALLNKKNNSEIEQIVHLYETAGSHVKSILNELFKTMGERAEDALMALLERTKNLPVRHNICTILDSTGYVESLIGLLKNSSSTKRMDAAEKLSTIGTLKACRGLLYGVKDINKNIRILTIKALVRINQDTEVLSILEKDPDKKVRRHASWAKERIKAVTLP